MKRISAHSFNYAKYRYDPFNIEQLPYPVNWDRLGKYENLYIEIGTGHGELISHLAKKQRENLFVGFEIAKEYCRRSVKAISGLSNAYVYNSNAYESALNLFADGSIAGIYILFPDPWHKKRHHKRRPLTSEWFQAVWHRLKPGGFILFATDWQEYFDFVSTQSAAVQNLYKYDEGGYKPELFDLPETHYYKKAIGGRNFKYIRLIKLTGPAK